MFYDEFVKLCNEKSVSRTKACIDCGVSRTAWLKWEDGATPNGTTITKFASYFGVPVGQLLGDEQKETPLVNGDQELTDYLEMLKNRPECRMLFQLTKNATKEDVEAAVRIIEALRNK